MAYEVCYPGGGCRRLFLVSALSDRLFPEVDSSGELLDKAVERFVAFERPAGQSSLT